MYLAVSTCSDKAYSVNYLARQMYAPVLRHMQITKRLLMYLSETAKLDLFYSKRGPMTANYIVIAVYADWEMTKTREDIRQVTYSSSTARRYTVIENLRPLSHSIPANLSMWRCRQAQGDVLDPRTILRDRSLAMDRRHHLHCDYCFL